MPPSPPSLQRLMAAHSLWQVAGGSARGASALMSEVLLALRSGQCSAELNEIAMLSHYALALTLAHTSGLYLGATEKQPMPHAFIRYAVYPCRPRPREAPSAKSRAPKRTWSEFEKSLLRFLRAMVRLLPDRCTWLKTQRKDGSYRYSVCITQCVGTRGGRSTG